jgi:hypothetical protein
VILQMTWQDNSSVFDQFNSSSEETGQV